MRTWLISAMLAGIACSAHAATWERVTASESGGFTIYVDSQSINKKGAVAKVWLRTVYSPAKTLQNGALSVYSIDSQKFNCAERTTALMSTTFYDAIGKVVGSYSEPNPAFEEVVPESVAEGILQVVCHK